MTRSRFDAAFEIALRLVRGRARSRSDVEKALVRRGFESEAPAVIARLLELRYLDDATFARARAESLLRGRLAPAAVRQRLEAKGVDQELIVAAIDEASDAIDFDPERSARALLMQRRLAPPYADRQSRARAARLLAARGFDEELIGRIVGLDPSVEGD